MSAQASQEIKDVTRCSWAKTPEDIQYHDTEWGVSVYDDKTLFEFLILEGAQAGLSWNTILKKRAQYKKVFHDFNPKKVARMNQEDVETLMLDAGIIRNRLKITSTITNAQAFLEVQKEFGTFSEYLWAFANNKTINNNVESLKNIPTRTTLSDTISKDLKKRGFRFVGTTIIYAYMQAVGLVNDHEKTCFCYKKIANNS